MNIEKTYNELRKLNAEHFEMMLLLIAKYFYRERKVCFKDDYGSYTIHNMLEQLSDKSIGEIWIQIYNCQSVERFNSIIDIDEKIIKNSDENEYSNMSIDKDENKHLPQYYEFVVAKYALSDSIEGLINNGAKEVIVTKVDGDLLVRYKPYWKK